MTGVQTCALPISAYWFTFQDDLCGCGGAGGGTATPFGENLGGANVGSLTTSSIPNPETIMELRVSGIPNGTTGTLFLSPIRIQRSAFGGTALVPTSTAPIKLPFRMSLGSASVHWYVPVGLCGTTIYAQAAASDPTQPYGRALTNGLALSIGL